MVMTAAVPFCRQKKYTSNSGVFGIPGKSLLDMQTNFVSAKSNNVLLNSE